MDRGTAAAIGTFLAAMQESAFQGRRPSYVAPNFWARTLNITRFRPVAPSVAFSDYLVVLGEREYIQTLTLWVATSLGDPAVSGIEYQFLRNGVPLSLPVFSPLAGVDYNKVTATTYPTLARPFFVLLGEKDRLQVQVRNLSAFLRYGVVALYGWSYATHDSSYPAADGGLSDEIYAPAFGMEGQRP